MSDSSITGLPSAGNVNASDYIVLDQNGSTRKATALQLAQAALAAQNTVPVKTTITPTNGQTALTVSSYVPGLNMVRLLVNGVELVSGSDYTETNSTALTLATGLVPTDTVIAIVNLAVPFSYTLATSVQYTPAGTGAVTTSTQNKLSEKPSVLDFGASTSATAAVNAAAFLAAWTASNPAAVQVPAGTYLFTGTVTGKFYSLGAVTISGGTVTSITNLVP